MNKNQMLLLYVTIAILSTLLPEVSSAKFRYNGVSYVSWTRGEYPYTYSWKEQTWWDSRAITSVAVTTNNYYEGKGSLELVVDSLCYSDSCKKSGEAYVDLRYYPPLWEPSFGKFAPLNMLKDTITAMVYCPAGSCGPDSAPNGLQLFVKDQNWKSFYGSWHNIYWWNKNDWKKVRVIPDTVKPNCGFMESGFDPTKIIALGLKVGANQHSPLYFSGTFYLDSVSWSDYHKPIYDFENVENSIENLSQNNCNFVSLVVTQYMKSATSDSISRDSIKTHTDEEIIETIGYLKSQGISVMLKPHIDVKDNTWRGAISPADKDAWFESYCQFITHYARIAALTKVNLFCIGTELESLSDSSYHSNWDEIIDLVKNEYDSMLTYAANWDGCYKVTFWDRMDLIGIDAYFPLSNLENPSLNTLEDGWTNYFDGAQTHNWVADIENLHNQYNKPIIFTEIGYGSYDYAAMEPWSLPDKDISLINCDLQARCYAAAFQVWNKIDWFQGMFWWLWHPFSDAGGLCDLGFTPQNKPAEDTLRCWYGKCTAVTHKEKPNLPEEPVLLGNYPNPFNSSTMIMFDINAPGQVVLKVYNIAGQEIITLLNEKIEDGHHKIMFDGSQLPSGVYFYSIQMSNFRDTKKMLLLR